MEGGPTALAQALGGGALGGSRLAPFVHPRVVVRAVAGLRGLCAARDALMRFPAARGALVGFPCGQVCDV